MKRTITTLLACVTLVAPAMATDWYNGGVGVTTTENDTDYTHYTLFFLNVNDTTYSDFAATLGALTYDEFQTKYGTATHSTGNSYDEESNVVLGRGDTGISTDVSTSNIYGTWVYNNGLSDNAQIIQFNVCATRNPMGTTLYGDSRKSSGWQSFKTTPEPATATLSLLALAGLAARRRRLR